MSGGHFDYMYCTIEEMYKDKLHDDDLNEMLIDFCELLHDLEWFESGDVGIDYYMGTVYEFKEKWLKDKE